MRRWLTLLLLVGTALPPLAAKSLSIEQLEQLLAENRGKADTHVAQQLADVELTERVSPERLENWEKNFPGPKTRETLMRLADTAAFLKTPATDPAPVTAPDSDMQQKILALAGEYVKTTITRLPNFYATRETTHFEDVPLQRVVNLGGHMLVVSPTADKHTSNTTLGPADLETLHVVSTTSATVTYHDGREVRDQDAMAEKKNQPVGMTTYGEFGPILAVVTGDAMHGTVAWDRWEQGAKEPVAVFRYAVPDFHSRYSVVIPDGAQMIRVYPGYHGEIAIDSETGEILRLSVVVEMPHPYEERRAAVLVEYAPVTIGDRTYICPVHGVAFSKVPVSGRRLDAQGSVMLQTQLNDVAFTHYHLFGSEARIVSIESENGAGKTPDAADSPDRSK